jgi:uncharacterized phage infection (PIP) family protein YhgE
MEATNDCDFAGVKALGKPGEAAAEQLSAVWRRLRDAGAHAAAERLRRVDHSAAQLDFPTLERLAAPERAIDELTGVEQAKAHRLLKWRNLTALFPLLWTWLVLALASSAYQRQLAQDPTKVDQPFLYLWEQRFGGSAVPSFTFSAAITVVLIVLVLALTAWAHQAENHTATAISTVSDQIDGAMNALMLAVDHHHRETEKPRSAEEWAQAAQRILANTETVLNKAIDQTKELTDSNREITENAKNALKTIQTDAQEFVTKFGGQVLDVLEAVKQNNEQAIKQVAGEATNVLAQAAEANQQLIGEQMAPLAKQFRETLDKFSGQHETYARAADALSKSAETLADNAESYSTIARSIDQQLRLIEGTQSGFIQQVDQSATSMRTAAQAMQELSNVMRGELRADLERIATNVVQSSSNLATVESGLARTSHALAGTTTAMRSASQELESAAARLERSRLRWMPWRRQGNQGNQPPK